MKRLFGLLGHPLGHSFSKGYFADKFQRENITDAVYQNFDIANIQQLPKSVLNKENLLGFNVTIPYKEAVIPFLEELSPTAEAIGAVNCVKRTQTGWMGHNTDAEGFANSIKPFLDINHSQALILGTGGSSKAVAHVFKQLGIPAAHASRNPQGPHQIGYKDLGADAVRRFPCIVNCTPLGMHPKVEAKPSIDYRGITPQHFCVDLIYNPEKTAFLEACEEHSATILNGHDMLVQQAEASWKFWNA